MQFVILGILRLRRISVSRMFSLFGKDETKESEEGEGRGLQFAGLGGRDNKGRVEVSLSPQSPVGERNLFLDHPLFQPPPPRSEVNRNPQG
jgi:hypothetical protein